MSFALCLLQNNAVPFPCLPWGGCRTPHQLLNILCEVQLGSTSPKSHFSCLLLDLKCIFFCWSAGCLFFSPPPVLWFVLLWGPAQSGCSTWSLVLQEFFSLAFQCKLQIPGSISTFEFMMITFKSSNPSCCLTAPKSTFCLGVQLSETANLKQ